MGKGIIQLFQKASAGEHCTTTGELLFKFAFSVAPVIFYYLLNFAMMQPIDAVRTHVKDLFINGDVLVYCTSVLSPAAFLAFFKKRDEEIFGKSCMFGLIALILPFSTAVYIFRKFDVIPSASFSPWISFIFLIASYFVLYIATLNHNIPPSKARKAFTSEQQDFLNKFLDNEGHDE